MGDEGELVDRRLFVATIEDADLRVRDTSTVPRLDVGLVLLEARAARGAAAHGGGASLWGLVVSLRVDGVWRCLSRLFLVFCSDGVRQMPLAALLVQRVGGSEELALVGLELGLWRTRERQNRATRGRCRL